MFKKTIAVALTAVVTCLSSIAQARSETGGQAQGQPDKAASVKAQVRKIGIGESFVVRVKLKDGTDLRGYLSQIENDSFTITDKATNKATSVSYGDVRSLKGKGLDRKSTRLNSSNLGISYAVFCLKIAVTRLEMTHDRGRDWQFFRLAARTMLWPKIDPDYFFELQGITEGLTSYPVKLVPF